MEGTNTSLNRNEQFTSKESVNPNQTGEGANMPHIISIAYYSGTKSQIDLKPDCKFKFVCCHLGFHLGVHEGPGGI